MALPPKYTEKGHPSWGGGRPRIDTFPPEEMHQLGEELLEWLDSEEEILHLSQWYSGMKKFTYNEWKMLIARSEFFPYYDAALKKVGLQYMRKDSPIEPSLKQRWQRVYFKDLREEEDETLAYKASLDKEKEKPVEESIERGFNSLMDQISGSQNLLKVPSREDIRAALEARKEGRSELSEQS